MANVIPSGVLNKKIGGSTIANRLIFPDPVANFINKQAGKDLGKALGNPALGKQIADPLGSALEASKPIDAPNLQAGRKRDAAASNAGNRFRAGLAPLSNDKKTLLGT